MTRLAVLGARGRMGSAVSRLAAGHRFSVVAELDAGGDPGAIVSSGAEAVVDFSVPDALVAACEVCEKAGIALVSGTTGLDERAREALDRLAARAPVIWEPNMSVGIHVLSTLVAKALASLGPGFDVEIVETHHRMKVDAPSGTALRLAEVVKSVRPGSRYVHGRDGRRGARADEELGVFALRGGDVIGDHTVYFFGEGERIELTHRASNRDLFAHGALRAARWAVGKPRGHYRLADVLA